MLSKLLTLGLRNEKDNKEKWFQFLFLTIIVQVCSIYVPIELKLYFIPISFTYDTKHGPQYTKTWLHEKGTFSIRIGHNKIYVWTHDTYIKIVECKTRNNSPPMYTSKISPINGLVEKKPLICCSNPVWLVTIFYTRLTMKAAPRHRHVGEMMVYITWFATLTSKLSHDKWFNVMHIGGNYGATWCKDRMPKRVHWTSPQEKPNL